MKNTTLTRKAGSDMKKNAGEVRPRTAGDQRGDGADFAFNGQMGDGVNRAGNRFAGNQAGLMMRENYGNGPRSARENSQASMHDHGPSVTKDAYRTAPDTARGEGVLGRTEVKFPKNPDAINVGNR